MTALIAAPAEEACTTVSRLIVVSGPSGAGKGTLLAQLRKRLPQLHETVSATTRTPRPGELDGVDYHFLTDEKFTAHATAGDFVEQATYSGHRYGTLRSEMRSADDQPALCEIDVNGAAQIRRAVDDALLVFIAPPDLSVLRDRLIARGTHSQEDLRRRLRRAAEERDRAGMFDHVVVNDDLETACVQLERLVRDHLAR